MQARNGPHEEGSGSVAGSHIAGARLQGDGRAATTLCSAGAGSAVLHAVVQWRCAAALSCLPGWLEVYPIMSYMVCLRNVVLTSCPTSSCQLDMIE